MSDILGRKGAGFGQGQHPVLTRRMMLMLGAAFFVCLSIGVANLGSSKTAAPAQPQAAVTPILVARETIEVGTAINSTPGLVQVVEWPKEQVPADALTLKEQLKGMYAVTKIVAGTPITSVSLSAEQPEIELEMAPGMREVAVEVDTSSFGDGLKADSYVDLMLTYNDADGKFLSELVAENIRVLRVNSSSFRGGLRPKNSPAFAGRGVTLEVSPEAQLRIATAKKMGTLMISRRNNGDSRVAATKQVGVDSFAGSSKGDKAASEPRTAVSSSDPECARSKARGKMKMNGQSYIIDCQGEVVLAE